MLVLQRKRGESIDIECFRITILEIRNSHVKLGIDAPNGVRILRTELLEKQERSDDDKRSD